MANSVDPDETSRSAASHLGLYCLLKPVCPNTYGKYGILNLNLLFQAISQKEAPGSVRVYKFIDFYIKEDDKRKKEETKNMNFLLIDKK